MTDPVGARVLDALTSLKLTIVCLALLMVLVVACTLAQVSLGTLGAVNLYMRSFLVWARLPGTGWSVAVFPGGGLVGLVLMVNLVAAQLRRLELSWRKLGIWIVHAGLILLFAGEFVTAMFQDETQLAIEQGQTVDFVESPRDQELAVVEAGAGATEDVYGVPTSLLARGGVVPIPGTPVALRVRRFWPSAALAMAGPSDLPSGASMGAGTAIAVRPVAAATSDEQVDQPAALVEPIAGGQSYGTWLVSAQLSAPQSFRFGGRSYELAMRPRREYLPYRVTLRKFSHDVYPGTDIPKNFSSLVHLSNPARGEERDVLIYMNQPLRYEGRAFYQASFGKNDTLSVLQVVKNPGWLIPYVSCVLVGVGLMIHFGMALRRSMRRRAAAGEV